MSSTPLCRDRTDVLSSGGREVLKWIALVLMTGDHVNKVVLHGAYSWLTDISRVVFPIFAIVMAYNLVSHPDAAATRRAMLRTLVTAVIVHPAYVVAFGGEILPLNVLFTLCAGCYVATEPNRVVALVVGLVAGAFVDYAWWGIGVVASAVHFFRAAGSFRAGVVLLAAVTSLAFVNGNVYALFAFPLVAIVGVWTIRVPRWRWTFLGYYVVHVAVLAAIASHGVAVMGH